MPDDGIFRAILAVLVISMVIGVAVMLAGFYVTQSEAMINAGTGLALMSGLAYGFFRLLGRREHNRRDRGGGDQGEP